MDNIYAEDIWPPITNHNEIVKEALSALDSCKGHKIPWPHLDCDAVKNDKINHPAHYTQGEIECIDALAAATTGLQGIEAVCTANAIKYLWRWKLKNGVEDLKKAQFYINHLINKLEKVDVKNESDSNG